MEPKVTSCFLCLTKGKKQHLNIYEMIWQMQKSLRCFEYYCVRCAKLFWSPLRSSFSWTDLPTQCWLTGWLHGRMPVRGYCLLCHLYITEQSVKQGASFSFSQKTVLGFKQQHKNLPFSLSDSRTLYFILSWICFPESLCCSVSCLLSCLLWSVLEKLLWADYCPYPPAAAHPCHFS